MNSDYLAHLSKTIETIKADGFYKSERIIHTEQSAKLVLGDGKEVLNLCANNYLGLANDKRLIEAAKDGLDNYGFGTASVRFICGTQDIHKRLEKELSTFLKTEDTILYSSCFDANGGLFETILGEEDAIISDALNHASIIDGIRLCKAKRFVYRNQDWANLEEKLKEADQAGARFKLIATDGVFSMDGIIADLKAICDIADRYNALVMVDDSHAVGFMGENGRGTPEFCGVEGRIDILTGTLGKALGGASGGYTSGKKEIIELLRQRSRPYLFSNSVAPSIVSASLKVLNLLSSEDGKRLREQVNGNGNYFRQKMQALGFDLISGQHPIIPIMIGEAEKARHMADALLTEGVYVVGFSYPVVPKGKARIRTQMNASLSTEQLDFAIQAFAKVKNKLHL